ncbi:hypothetical protein D3C78_1781690 [compost metagenome]
MASSHNNHRRIQFFRLGNNGFCRFTGHHPPARIDPCRLEFAQCPVHHGRGGLLFILRATEICRIFTRFNFKRPRYGIAKIDTTKHH